MSHCSGISERLPSHPQCSGPLIPRALTEVPLCSLSLPAAHSGAQEVTITAAESQYCFDGLTSDALYNATVFTQTPNLEGPGVSVKEKTCKYFLNLLLLATTSHMWFSVVMFFFFFILSPS